MLKTLLYPIIQSVIERVLDKPLISDEELVIKPPQGEIPEFVRWLMSDESQLPLRRPSMPQEGTQEEFGDHRNGHFCICVRQKRGGPPDLALKFVINPEGHSPSTIAKGDKGAYEALKNTPIGPFLVKTLHVITNGPEGPIPLQMQPWISGRAVGEYSIEEIFSNRTMVKALKEFTIRLLATFIQGKLVDYWGFGLKSGLALWKRVSVFSVLASRNLIWSEGGLVLIDTTTHPYKQETLPLKTRAIIFFNLIKDLFLLSIVDSGNRKPKYEKREKLLFAEGVQAVVTQLDQLKRQYGLDYRIVGGVAAAAILNQELLPFRQDGSRRDIDIVFLNPQVVPREEIVRFRQWADGQGVIHSCFPQVSLVIALPPDQIPRRRSFLPPHWCYLTRFARDEHNTTFLCFEGSKISLPPEALQVEELQYMGVRFFSFPQWFHYILYLTRNGGYIRKKDREKVALLEEITRSNEFGATYLRQIEGFVATIRRQYSLHIALNKVRLRTHKLWEWAVKLKHLI